MLPELLSSVGNVFTNLHIENHPSFPLRRHYPQPYASMAERKNPQLDAQHQAILKRMM